MTTFGERLRKARKRRGLSQMDVFDAIGISNKSLSRYENGDTAPNPETLKRLIRLYDVSSEYILGLTAEMGHSADNASPDGENLIDMTDNRSSAEKLTAFIAASPTTFHAVDNIVRKLSNEGFEPLGEWEDWQIAPGGKYFVTRNGSAVLAFKVGEGDPSGFNIYAAHCDSPTFKLKPDAELETLGHYIRLNTEAYGGGIMSSWLDRPLSVAGRAAVSTPGGVKTQLVNLENMTVVIPNVAIHMQRNVNDGFAFNPQVDTIPLPRESAKRISSEQTSTFITRPPERFGEPTGNTSRRRGSTICNAPTRACRGFWRAETAIPFRSLQFSTTKRSAAGPLRAPIPTF